MTAHHLRSSPRGHFYRLAPALEGHRHVLVTNAADTHGFPIPGTAILAATADGSARMTTDGTPVLLFWTDQSPQDALVDLGYTREVNA